MSEALFPLLALAVVAPIVGSFLGVVVARLPEHRQVIFGRSACDVCGETLGLLDLFPVASFLASRGRCRHCGGRIDPTYPLIELGSLVAVLWAATVESGWMLLATSIFGWLVLTIAILAVRAKEIPKALAAVLALAMWIVWLYRRTIF